MSLTQLKSALLEKAIDLKAEFLPRFFKAGPGEYGEGDKFIGVSAPHMRAVAKDFYSYLTLKEVEQLLTDKIHEYRLTALFILVLKFQKAKKEDDPQALRKEIIDLYIRNVDHVNNWDLVDSSADKLLGAYLEDKDKSLLYDFAKADHLWKQRIAIIATLYYIRKKEFKETFRISEMLLNHHHDLIHKAVGWMLREIGNKDFGEELAFLKKHYRIMPRTMLRYAIEKFDEPLRQQFLKGEI
jgi:3-methyladenine DNA glycosylase AlkD